MKKADEKKLLIAGGAILILAGLGYGGYRFHLLYQDNLTLLERVVGLEAVLSDTEGKLARSEHEGALLAEALQNEQDRIESIKGTLEEVTGTVNDLEKLSQLDAELLQKYSKVYFLNEHYEPEGLRTIPKKFLYYEDNPEQIHTRVYSFLKDLLEEAEDDGADLFVVSGFRSFGEQASLKSGYVFTYGAGTANSFSADQGYSEHQLGTTVDFLTTGINGTLDGFEKTDAYEWLLDNAYKFGFVLSYPEGNSYYQFEPWHWRFVGQELARDLHRDKINFYDTPQRDIDKYLLEIFD